LHDFEGLERDFKRTTNYTKRSDATVETVLGILLDLMERLQNYSVHILSKFEVRGAGNGWLKIIRKSAYCQTHEQLSRVPGLSIYRQA
jgi:hypothetical protein